MTFRSRPRLPRSGSATDARGGSEILAGWHAVHEALVVRGAAVGRVLISEARKDARTGELSELARRHGIPLVRVPPGLLEKLAPRGVPHQGILAEVSARRYADPTRLLEGSRHDSLFVVLDGVQDPRNLGAILRTAAAVGATAVFLPVRGAAPLTAAAVRSSAGGVESIPVARTPSLGRLLDQMADRGIHRVALDPRANDLYTEMPGEGPIALVLGGEEKGIRPGLLSRCDHQVRIPVPGAVASLNVSVAAGIALYEVLRARSRPPRPADPQGAC